MKKTSTKPTKKQAKEKIVMIEQRTQELKLKDSFNRVKQDFNIALTFSLLALGVSLVTLLFMVI